MNIISFNDSNFINTETYKNFINKNKGNGTLNIRAYAASRAVPISGLNVIVSKILDNQKVIFFEGATDNSGIINQIILPTPLLDNNNQEVPLSQDYDIIASYNNQKLVFKVLIYSNIQVNQNINIVPQIRLDGKSYGN